MSGKIKPIKAKDNNGIEQVIFPNTVLEAVIDSETNKTLDVILDEMNGGSGVEVIENLLIYPYAITTTTDTDYSIIDNKDGTLSINCNIPNNKMNVISIVFNQSLSAGTYTVSGCPEGFAENSVYIQVSLYDSSRNRISNNKIFYGQDFTFTITELSYLVLSLYFNSNASLTNAILKPMLELGTVAHDYVPYKDVSVLSKTGGVINGKLTVKDNVSVEGDLFVPITPAQTILNPDSPNNNFTAPTAGTWENNNNYLMQDLSNSKSFSGTYYGPVDSEGHVNTWHDVISVRHRNGLSDGSNYGMYIRSNTSSKGSLCWSKQYSGNWENEKTIIDTDALRSTATTDVGMDDVTTNAIGYVKVGNLYGQTDGAMYKQVYSDLWAHEIYGDYRTGQIAVRGKNNGTWQSWRGVLDSSNYSSYALPLTGGTVTGNTTFDSAINLPKGHLVTNFTSGGGDNGYVKFAFFTCYSHATYAGAPMSFRMTTRGATGIVHLNITNSATAGQGFTGYISQTGNIPQCYMIQSSTGVFELYVAKSAWDWISITDFVFPQYQQHRMTVTWTDTFVASLPSGATAARVTNDWSGIVESADESGSVSFTMKAGCSYLISVRHITQGTMFATGIIVATPSSWSYYSIGVGGSAFHSISGSTFTYSFGGSSSLAKGKVQLKYIEIC